MVKGGDCASVASLKIEGKAVCSVGSPHREISLFFSGQPGHTLVQNISGTRSVPWE